jgi:hypothetical protein
MWKSYSKYEICGYQTGEVSDNDIQERECLVWDQWLEDRMILRMFGSYLPNYTTVHHRIR